MCALFVKCITIRKTKYWSVYYLLQKYRYNKIQQYLNTSVVKNLRKSHKHKNTVESCAKCTNIFTIEQVLRFEKKKNKKFG